MGNFCNCQPCSVDVDPGTRRDGNMDYSGNIQEYYTTESSSSLSVCSPGDHGHKDILKPTPDYESSNRWGRSSSDRGDRDSTRSGTRRGKTRTIRDPKSRERMRYGSVPEEESDDSAGSVADMALPTSTSAHMNHITSQSSCNSEGSPPGDPKKHNQYSSDYTKDEGVERPPKSHYSSHSPHSSQSSRDRTRPATNIKFAEHELMQNSHSTHSMGYTSNDSRYRSGIAFVSHPVKMSQSVGPQGTPSDSEETEKSGCEVSCPSTPRGSRELDEDDLGHFTKRLSKRLSGQYTGNLNSQQRPHPHHNASGSNRLSRDSRLEELSDRYDLMGSEYSNLFHPDPNARWSVPPKKGHFAASHSLPMEDFQRSSLPASSFFSAFPLGMENLHNIAGVRSVPNSFKIGYQELQRMVEYEKEDIPGALQQMVQLKTLDAPKQIIVILDGFLSDYRMYQDKLNGNTYTIRYLFDNGIIGNLMYAWNMGVDKMNCTLIALAIMSLSKFTHRNDFRVPFIAHKGLRLIGKTLSIPALKASNTDKSNPRSGPKKVTMLMSVTSMDSIEFPTFSFGHILAVLKMTRDICKEEVIDSSNWLTSGIHQKVLATMKRDLDEPRITKACRNTLNALLDASYEIGEAIINDEQIHDMIDLFLDSTTREHVRVHTRKMAKQRQLSGINESPTAREARALSNQSLQSSAIGLAQLTSDRSQDPFGPLADPLFSRSTDTINFSVGTPGIGDIESELKKPPRHRKKKNLFELEQAEKMRQNTATHSARDSIRESTRDRSHTANTLTSERSQLTETTENVGIHRNDSHLVHRMLSNITDNNTENGDDEMSEDEGDNMSENEGSVIKRQGNTDRTYSELVSDDDETMEHENHSTSGHSPRSIQMPLPREVDRETLTKQMAILITSEDPLSGGDSQRGSNRDSSQPSNPNLSARISGSHSRFSVLSDATDASHATNQTALHRCDSARSQSSTESIMSLTEYDRICAEVTEKQSQDAAGKSRKSSRGSVEIMAEIMEEDEEKETSGRSGSRGSGGSAQTNEIMNVIFDGHFNDSDEEKSHTVKTSPISVLGDATLEALHGMAAMDIKDIRLDPHQLLYINCLFHILYKIITLTRRAPTTTQRRPASARTPHLSFAERLKNEKRKRQVSNTVSGDTVGFLSSMDSAYMTNEKGPRISKLKNLNHGQNKLLEVFFQKRSFLNLFKVLKCYKLTANPMGYGHEFDGFMADQVDPYHSHPDDVDDPLGGYNQFGEYKMSKNSSASSDSDVVNDREDKRMVSVVMLGCKILRKVLDYSQVITDKLLGDEELDIIGLLVKMLLDNNMNIDLNIYILDILGRMTEMEDVRELLLSPEYFDNFLRALDPWWLKFINAAQKMSESLRGDVLNQRMNGLNGNYGMNPMIGSNGLDRLENDGTLSMESPDGDAHDLMSGDLMDDLRGDINDNFMTDARLQRLISTNSIGVVGKVEVLHRSRTEVDAELHIAVTIAMLKFFNELSKTNPLDIVEYSINERILVLLDFYLIVSLTHDPIEPNETHSFDDVEWDMEMATDYKFVFSDKKHEECLMLCLECIQNLATDINMVLEFVVSKTCEKLSRICWSFRDNPSMIKTCCAVIAKLLKLEQSCEEVQAKKQDVLSPLVAVCVHIFRRAYYEHGQRISDLIIAHTLYPEASKHRQMEQHFMQQQARDSSLSPRSPHSPESPLSPESGATVIQRKASVEPRLAPILEPDAIPQHSYSQSESFSEHDHIEFVKYKESKERAIIESNADDENSEDDQDGNQRVDTPVLGPLVSSNSSDSFTLRKGLKLTMPGIQESAVNSKENSPSPHGQSTRMISFLATRSAPAPTGDHRVRFDQPAPVKKASTVSVYSSVASPSSAFGGHLADLRDLFNVFIKISCVDEFCVEMIRSDMMLILLECISNSELQLHRQPMTSLNFSDFMLSLTKNTKGRVELLRSSHDVTFHISNAIGNNINNRGVVMKYLYALLNLKAGDRKLLRSQLIANGGMEFLMKLKAPMTYKDAFSNSLRNLLRDEESEDESDYVK